MAFSPTPDGELIAERHGSGPLADLFRARLSFFLQGEGGRRAELPHGPVLPFRVLAGDAVVRHDDFDAEYDRPDPQGDLQRRDRVWSWRSVSAAARAAKRIA